MVIRSCKAGIVAGAAEAKRFRLPPAAAKAQDFVGRGKQTVNDVRKCGPPRVSMQAGGV
jgi:hypothetical protein